MELKGNIAMSHDQPYLLFLPHSTPAKHRVFAVVDEPGWDELRAVATFNHRWEAVRLADALNELLAGGGLASEFVAEAVTGAPGPVRAEVERIAATITTDIASKTDGGKRGRSWSRYGDALIRPSICGVMRFPLGPTNSGEDEYEPWGDITPRTAGALQWAGECLADEVSELGDEALPPRLQGQGSVFRRKFAKSVETLVDDLSRGERPEPRCTAEEIGLWLMIGDAEALVEDMRPAALEDLPTTEFDYAFDDIRESLYQDLDFHDFFEPVEKKTIFAESLDGLFEPFNYPPPRPRRRPSVSGLR
ncbi:hypothetical protein [Nocardia asiatica]|uniref:hypothetical protein n=1 Tax=Nocardia asiatica TaxID=209252 RepID=UPI003EE30308